MPKAIESLLNQQYENWELIIVDDGSSDNTKAIVTSYLDKRIRYVYQDNAERSAARNNGIRHAKGEYVGFLDSDDQFKPSHLQKLYEYIEESKFEQAIYVVKSLAKNSQSKEEKKLALKIGASSIETVLLNSITPGQFTIPANLAKKEGFDEKIRISEDTEILIRLIKHLELKIIDEYSLIYVLHEDNSVNTDRYNAFLDRKNTLSYIFDNISDKSVSKDLRNKLLNNCYFGIYRYHKAKGNFFKSKWNILVSILKYPRLRLKEKVYLLIRG
mgnify:CR=1 FL=1